GRYPVHRVPLPGQPGGGLHVTFVEGAVLLDPARTDRRDQVGVTATVWARGVGGHGCPFSPVKNLGCMRRGAVSLTDPPEGSLSWVRSFRKRDARLHAIGGTAGPRGNPRRVGGRHRLSGLPSPGMPFRDFLVSVRQPMCDEW